MWKWNGMERKTTNPRKRKLPATIKVSLPIRVIIGGLAYGIIKNKSLQLLLDDESLHEFQDKREILEEFAKWFINPKEELLKTRHHITVLRYLISVYLRAYQRNKKHGIVLKLSDTDSVVIIRS